MNPRQRFALDHPYEGPLTGDISVYRAERRHGSGLLLRTILAVDR